jgi:thiamine-monophosphate kinase
LQLKDLGEFKLIELIRERVPDAAGVRRGIGDDAAVLTLPTGHSLLTSTDMLIEGVHFQHAWTPAEDLGHKVVAVNLSDIAAMGGVPRYLFLGLACPGTTAVDQIEAFLKGVLDEAAAHQVCLVGGDTCQSSHGWLISVTIEGTVAEGREVSRSGARANDLIMVSGTLGDSALALQLLQKGQSPPADLRHRHNRPSPRVALGRRLAEQGLVTAMIDISDGLAGDLQHILKASRVDGLIETSQLPLSGVFRASLAQDPALLELALFGGEDYELLFTVPEEHVAAVMAQGDALALPVTCIGTAQPGAGQLLLRDETGELQSVSGRGYDHFCRP